MTPLQEAEIHEKWAKTIRMCAEHGIVPYYKLAGSFKYNLIIDLSIFELEHLEFALAIVEGKLVFEGDEPYYGTDKIKALEGWAVDGHHFLAYELDGKRYEHGIPSKMSWNPPKPKTVMVEMTVEDAEFLRDKYGNPELSFFKNSLSYRLAKSCEKALDSLK